MVKCRLRKGAFVALLVFVALSLVGCIGLFRGGGDSSYEIKVVVKEGDSFLPGVEIAYEGPDVVSGVAGPTDAQGEARVGPLKGTVRLTFSLDDYTFEPQPLIVDKKGTYNVTASPPGDPEPGDAVSYTLGGVEFRMRYAPSASFISDDPEINGHISLPSDITVENPFLISETQVTYELWKEVYDWATHPDRWEEQYTFANEGAMGGSLPDGAILTNQHPVSTFSWRDAIVWCNALTEYYNAEYGEELACVYKRNGIPLRNSRDGEHCDAVEPDEEAKGFRLASSAEWQLAARYEDGFNWTPGDHVSGDTSGPCYSDDGGDVSTVFDDYCWHGDNCNVPDPDIRSSQPVGLKLPNALGLYDMSGNAWEFVFDWVPWTPGEFRMLRGGSWGFVVRLSGIAHLNGVPPGDPFFIFGFRPVRTL